MKLTSNNAAMTTIEIVQYHCIKMPAINGNNNLIKGAVFQNGMIVDIFITKIKPIGGEKAGEINNHKCFFTVFKFILVLACHFLNLKFNIMGVLSWILFGLIAGAIAKMLHRGDDPGGWIVTIIIGIVGAFIGGALAKFLFGWTDAMGWNWHSYVSSVGGAILVLIIYRMATKK